MVPRLSNSSVKETWRCIRPDFERNARGSKTCTWPFGILCTVSWARKEFICNFFLGRVCPLYLIASQNVKSKCYRTSRSLSQGMEQSLVDELEAFARSCSALLAELKAPIESQESGTSGCFKSQTRDLPFRLSADGNMAKIAFIGRLCRQLALYHSSSCQTQTKDPRKQG